jgi:hypothetical protein
VKTLLKNNKGMLIMSISRNYVISIPLLIIGVLLSIWFLANRASLFYPPSQATVKGIAERVVKADLGTWTLSFNVTGSNITALSEQFSQAQAKIIAFLRQAGFTSEEISPGSLFVRDSIEFHSTKLLMSSGSDSAPKDRFQIAGDIRVQSPRLNLFSQATRQLPTLLSSGVAVNAGDVRYHIRHFDQLRPGMLSDALKSALAMARKVARDMGMNPGHIISVNQGRFSIEDPITGDRYNDNSTMKKVRVVSTFRVALKQRELS